MGAPTPGRPRTSGPGVPSLLAGQQHIGALIFASRQKNAFGRREVEALTLVARQIATAVNNALAFRQIADLRDRFRRKNNTSKRSLISKTVLKTSLGKVRNYTKFSGTLKPSHPLTQQF